MFSAGRPWSYKAHDVMLYGLTPISVLRQEKRVTLLYLNMNIQTTMGDLSFKLVLWKI